MATKLEQGVILERLFKWALAACFVVLPMAQMLIMPWELIWADGWRMIIAFGAMAGLLFAIAGIALYALVKEP